MRWSATLVALLGLTACSISEDKYRDDVPEALCDYYQSCDPPFFDDAADCIDEQQGDLPETGVCTYDADLAAQCLDALSSLACQGSANNVPASCAQVYDCTAAE